MDILSASNETPTMPLIYDSGTSIWYGDRSGYTHDFPSGLITSTGSTSNFCSQYTENMVTIVFKTILAFVKSVAVHSMNTFFVFKVMAECATLIIGGKDKTVLQLQIICKGAEAQSQSVQTDRAMSCA